MGRVSEMIDVNLQFFNLRKGMFRFFQCWVLEFFRIGIFSPQHVNCGQWWNGKE